MNHEEFNALIKEYQAGGLNPEHRALLDKWFDTVGTDSGEVWTNVELEQLRDKIMKQVLEDEPNRRSFFRFSRRWLPYAAAVLLICLGGIYYYQTTIPPIESDNVSSSDPLIESSIQPGGNKAMLTLADGRTIALSSDHTGIVVGDKLMYEDGTALLEQGADGREVAGSVVEDYQLTTPKGGQYEMTLPDGSRVWLNAASTLKYPSRFVGSVREVELAGEAYFEIAKRTDASGPVPFIVRTADQEVLVLGTEFNIAAYADEVETRTTLVEGAVMVRQSVNGITEKETELIPGEESVLTSSGIKTRKANIASSTAWKSGIFAFDNIPFDQMMKQIARWYDINVVYEGKIPHERFKGKMSRNVDLNVLISFLQDSGIDLRAEGRTVYVEK